MRIHQAALFLILSSVFVAGALGAPAVQSVTAPAAHGELATITGSGFGVKDPVAPLVWDDFEAGSVDEDLANWSLGKNSCDACIHPRYSSTRDYGPGAQSARLNFTNGQWNCAMFLNLRANPQTTLYMHFKWHWSRLNGDWSRNFKMGRFEAWEPDEFHGAPNMGPTGQFGFSEKSAWAWRFNSGGKKKYLGYARIHPDVWSTMEMGMALGAKDKANGSVFGYLDGRVVGEQLGNVTTLATGADHDGFRSVVLPHYCDHSPGGDHEGYVDDVYIDTTFARVMICRGASWAKRTTCEIQLPTAWSDTEITIKLNAGEFKDADKAYLYVVDEKGVANKKGKPLKWQSTPTR